MKNIISASEFCDSEPITDNMYNELYRIGMNITNNNPSEINDDECKYRSLNKGCWDTHEYINQTKQPPKLAMITTEKSSFMDNAGTNSVTTTKKVNPPKLTPIYSPNMMPNSNNMIPLNSPMYISNEQTMIAQQQYGGVTPIEQISNMNCSNFKSELDLNSNNISVNRSIQNMTTDSDDSRCCNNSLMTNTDVVDDEFKFVTNNNCNPINIDHNPNIQYFNNQQNNIIGNINVGLNSGNIDVFSMNNLQTQINSNVQNNNPIVETLLYGNDNVENGPYVAIDNFENILTAAALDNLKYNTPNNNQCANAINIQNLDTSVSFGDHNMLPLQCSTFSPSMTMTTNGDITNSNSDIITNNLFQYVDFLTSSYNDNNSNAIFGDNSMLHRHFYESRNNSRSSDLVIAKPPGCGPITNVKRINNDQNSNNFFMNGIPLNFDNVNNSGISPFNEFSTLFTNSLDDINSFCTYTTSTSDMLNNKIDPIDNIQDFNTIAPSTPQRNSTAGPIRRQSSSRRRHGGHDPQSAVKRHNHNMLERKRRSELRDSFTSLIELLPELGGISLNRLSKVKILMATTKRINIVNTTRNLKDTLIREKRRLIISIVDKLKYLSSNNLLSVADSLPKFDNIS